MRSMLFVPGDRPERFAKAAASGADAVILDLEDAVLPERRPYARGEIAQWLANSERRVPMWVRINAVGTADALPDLAAVIGGRPDGIVLPKARDGADVHRTDHWLESLEARCGHARGGIGLLPLITESAGALLKAASFTALPARVTGLTWGAEDLAADVGALAPLRDVFHLLGVRECAQLLQALVAITLAAPSSTAPIISRIMQSPEKKPNPRVKPKSGQPFPNPACHWVGDRGLRVLTGDATTAYYALLVSEFN